MCGPRDHLVRGYTFNQKRLPERGLLAAGQTLDLLARTLQPEVLAASLPGRVAFSRRLN